MIILDCSQCHLMLGFIRNVQFAEKSLKFLRVTIHIQEGAFDTNFSIRKDHFFIKTKTEMCINNLLDLSKLDTIIYSLKVLPSSLDIFKDYPRGSDRSQFLDSFEQFLCRPKFAQLLSSMFQR